VIFALLRGRRAWHRLHQWWLLAHRNWCLARVVRGRRGSGRAVSAAWRLRAIFEDYLDEASEHGKTARPDTTIDMQ